MSAYINDEQQLFVELISKVNELKVLRQTQNWKPKTEQTKNLVYIPLPGGVSIEYLDDAREYAEVLVYCDLPHASLKGGDLNALVFALDSNGFQAVLDTPTFTEVSSILDAELNNIKV